jgi:UrcA family protein
MNPPVTIAMILCGIVGTASVATAVAATPEDDAPSLVVKYDPVSLLSDSGAHAVYRKIVAAAEQVCPQNPGSFLLTQSFRECRAQAVARAVMKIDNPRLAAIHNSASRSG